LHFKQESTMHPTPTASPAWNPLTFFPTLDTIPHSSCPGT